MKENHKTEEILRYLKNKYNREFSVDNFIPGNETFPELYGADKIIVHPTDNREEIFIAYESSKEKKVFYDNYLLAKWAEELKSSIQPSVIGVFGEDVSFKVILNAAYDKFDASMAKMKVDEYLRINNDVNVTLKLALKCSEKPDIQQYEEQLFELFNSVKAFGTTEYALSVGFVDNGEDISDYISTANVNNASWTNLKKKVYGFISVDETKTVKTPSDLRRLYRQIEE